MADWMGKWLAALGAYPEARRAISALDPRIQEALNRAMEPMDLQAGEILFTRGEPRDAVFLILGGRLALTQENAPERVFCPGEGVGEIGLAAHGPHTTTAQALEDARVVRLGRIAFEGLCERYPEAMAGLADFITPVVDETLLARVICDLVGEQDAAHLSALLADMTCAELKRGQLLYQQGEEADRMFVVISGRLRMVDRDAEGREIVVDEVGRGDTLGWRSLVTGDVRATTVYALRDSAVGVITRPILEHLKRQYPETMARLARIAMRRARDRDAAPGCCHGSDAVSLVVLPVGTPKGGVPLAAFAERLASALAAAGSTLHLSSRRLEGLVGRPDIFRAGAGHPVEAALASWLRHQEQSHRYVVYEADEGWTPWTQRCLSMADRVLLVGQGTSAPMPSELDEPLARLSDPTITELVLLQPDHLSRPSGTAAWLVRYAATCHHHIRLGQAADFDSFVRRITGHGLGLVLGGGGARGFAHIGVTRALEECKVDVDLVGGTSMGAILGAMYAMDLDYRHTLKLAGQMASPFRLFDPTLPAVSFFASAKVTRVLKQIFGDAQIEDLWMPYFCVSSNLTHAVAVVHRRGPLWQAVRASMAIPGLFSPILLDGDLLVDGCVLNNLPIEVMQRLNHDGPIIAVNVFPDVDLLRDYRFGPSVSGWQALAGRLNPIGRRDSGAPLIFESLLRVLALNDVHQAKTKRGFADVYIRPPVEQYNILDFRAYAQIADAGYRSALEVLAGWEGLDEHQSRHAGTVSARPRARPVREGSITARLHSALAELDELLTRMESAR